MIRNLLGSSKGVRDYVKNKITQKRIPIPTKQTTTIEEIDDEEAPLARRPVELPKAEIYMTEYRVGKVLPGRCVLQTQWNSF